ncbi:hypothetical protein B0H10DRAFT_1950982 [Mycena sp. CBHHK59/15]|nr:hypothetical protein B0H10DRAFT_1950982 [Mycena sp. CBHHK59/15]
MEPQATLAVRRWGPEEGHARFSGASLLALGPREMPERTSSTSCVGWAERGDTEVSSTCVARSDVADATKRRLTMLTKQFDVCTDERDIRGEGRVDVADVVIDNEAIQLIDGWFALELRRSVTPFQDEQRTHGITGLRVYLYVAYLLELHTMLLYTLQIKRMLEVDYLNISPGRIGNERIAALLHDDGAKVGANRNVTQRLKEKKGLCPSVLHWLRTCYNYGDETRWKGGQETEKRNTGKQRHFEARMIEKKNKRQKLMDPRRFIADAAEESDREESEEEETDVESVIDCASGDEQPLDYVCRRAGVNGDGSTQQARETCKKYTPWAALLDDAISPEQIVADLLKRRKADAELNPRGFLVNAAYEKMAGRVLNRATELTMIWKVAVVVGHEADVVNTLLNVGIAQPSAKIISAVALAAVRGYVFVEATERAVVDAAIRTVFFMRWKPSPVRLSGHECNELFTPQVGAKNMTHSWVRYTELGVYCGDLAWVVQMNEERTHVKLWLVPRVRRSDDKKRGDGRTRPNDRPGRLLFCEKDLIQEGGRRDLLGENDKKKNSFIFEEESYHHGFKVLEHVPLYHVCDVEVGATDAEVQSFRCSPMYAEMANAVTQHAQAVDAAIRVMCDLDMLAYRAAGKWDGIRELREGEKQMEAGQNMETHMRLFGERLGRAKARIEVEAVRAQNKRDREHELRAIQRNIGVYSASTKPNIEAYLESERRREAECLARIAEAELEDIERDAKADRALLGQLPPTPHGLQICASAKGKLFGLDILSLGDRVRVLVGELTGRLGTVEEVLLPHNVVVVFPDDNSKDLPSIHPEARITLPACDVVTAFELGDAVRVGLGRYTGQLGYLVHISWDRVVGYMYYRSVEVKLHHLERTTSAEIHIDDSGERENAWGLPKDLSVQDPELQSPERLAALRQYDNPPARDQDPSTVTEKKTERERYKHMEVIVTKGDLKQHFGIVRASRENGEMFDVALENTQAKGTTAFRAENLRERFTDLPLDVAQRPVIGPSLPTCRDKNLAVANSDHDPRVEDEHPAESSNPLVFLQSPNNDPDPCDDSEADVALSAAGNWLLDARLESKVLDVFINVPASDDKKFQHYHDRRGYVYMKKKPTKATNMVVVRTDQAYEVLRPRAEHIFPITTIEREEPRSSRSVLETPGTWVVIIGSNIAGDRKYIGSRGKVVLQLGAEYGLVDLQGKLIEFAESSICRSESRHV